MIPAPHDSLLWRDHVIINARNDVHKGALAWVVLHYLLADDDVSRADERYPLVRNQVVLDYLVAFAPHVLHALDALIPGEPPLRLRDHFETVLASQVLQENLHSHVDFRRSERLILCISLLAVDAALVSADLLLFNEGPLE